MTAQEIIVTVSGAALTDFDQTAHRANRLLARDGWDAEPGFTRSIAEHFTGAVGTALARCRAGRRQRREMEFVTATCYGTTHVAEGMHERLRLAGPRWLDPESFIFYSPHALTSAAAMAHGIGGAGCTLLGADAGAHALGHAFRRLLAGRAASVLVGGYEASTPFSVAALETIGLASRDTRGEAVAIVLERAPGPSGPALAVRRRLAGIEAVHGYLRERSAAPVTAIWPITADAGAAVAAPSGFPGAQVCRTRATGPATASLRALAEAVGRVRDGGCGVVLGGSAAAFDVAVVLPAAVAT